MANRMLAVRYQAKSQTCELRSTAACTRAEGCQQGAQDLFRISAWRFQAIKTHIYLNSCLQVPCTENGRHGGMMEAVRWKKYVGNCSCLQTVQRGRFAKVKLCHAEHQVRGFVLHFPPRRCRGCAYS